MVAIAYASLIFLLVWAVQLARKANIAIAIALILIPK
jgi:hypothetical protein